MGNNRLLPETLNLHEAWWELNLIKVSLSSLKKKRILCIIMYLNRITKLFILGLFKNFFLCSYEIVNLQSLNHIDVNRQLKTISRWRCHIFLLLSPIIMLFLLKLKTSFFTSYYRLSWSFRVLQIFFYWSFI